MPRKSARPSCGPSPGAGVFDLDSRQVSASSVNRVQNGVLAIDGKTLRRSFDRATGCSPLHVVTAFGTGASPSPSGRCPRGRTRHSPPGRCSRPWRSTASWSPATPAARRDAAAHLRTSLEVSERRACSYHCVGPEHGPLPRKAPRRRCAARAVAGARGSASAVRLPPPACSAAKRGLDHEPQEDPAALRRGRAGGAPAPVAPPHRGGAHADPAAGGAQQPAGRPTSFTTSWRRDAVSAC